MVLCALKFNREASIFKQEPVQTRDLPQIKPGSNIETLERYFLPALVVLCAVVFFYGLGSLPFIGPDEPRYAEVAREMHRSGDWITPRLGGIKWFEKPALTYWLSAIGYKLFGETEFAARFGIAIVASIGVLLLYFFGKRIRSARFGYLSAAALATCGLWPGFARGATFDLPLSVAMGLALFSFFIWESREEKKGKNRLWWIFCFALGLAVLAKGLIGIVLPAAIIGSYLLLTGRLKVILNPKLLLLGTTIFLVTAATWYAPIIARHGREFVNEFFIGHHFQRYLSNKYKHPQPIYFFPLVVFFGSFPWSLVFLASAWQALKNRRELFNDRLRLFSWLWVLWPILFFSFSGSKLPGYILPLFPALALLIGDKLEAVWEENSRERWGKLILPTGLWIALAALGVFVVGREEWRLSYRAILPLAIAVLLIATVYLLAWRFRNGQTATLALPFCLAGIVVVAAHTFFSVLGNRESLSNLAQIAARSAIPDEKLIFYVNADHAFDFYAADLPLRDTKSELVTTTSADNLALLITASKCQSMLVASPKRWSDGVTKSEKLITENLGEQNFNAKCSPECDWVLLRARRRQ